MSLIFITFIFTLNGKTFYGKYYTDYISPDHEGLDEVIKPYLVKGLNEYNKHENLPEIKENIQIGIISVSDHKYISIHSSNDEKLCFDFYCEKFNINYKIHLRMYVFGKLIE